MDAINGFTTSTTNSANIFTVYQYTIVPITTKTTLSTNTVIGCGAGSSSVTIEARSSANTPIYKWLPINSNSPKLNITSSCIYTLVVIYAIISCSISAQISIDGSTIIPQGADAWTGVSIACLCSTVVLNGITTTTNTSFSWTGPSATSSIAGTETTSNPIVTEVGNYTLTVTDNLTGY